VVLGIYPREFGPHENDLGVVIHPDQHHHDRGIVPLNVEIGEAALLALSR
jgi:hypothetical protein